MRALQALQALILLALSAAALVLPPARAQAVLDGDARLSCEAILCLASGTRPDACAASLARYFGINLRKFGDTLRARANFLNICPIVSTSPQLRSLVQATVEGAGRCDAAWLNANHRYMRSDGEAGSAYISNQIPEHCSSYLGNEYTQSGDLAPKYVGAPDRGGFWVSAQEFVNAQADYEARISQDGAAQGVR